jgi:hypothetical protein
MEAGLLLGIPFDFVLFAATLLGIALFHRHTNTAWRRSLGRISSSASLVSWAKHGRDHSLKSLRC